MAQLTEVNITSRPTLVFGGQASTPTQMQLVNLDPSVIIYVSNVSNPVIGQSGVFPLAPSDSISFDGSISVYAITPDGTSAILGVVPGGSNYASGTIAITGPVTATISGTVEVDGTVNIGTIAGSIDIDTVAGNVNVEGVGGSFPPGTLAAVFQSAMQSIAANSAVNLIGGSNMPVSSFASILLNAKNIANSSVAAGAAVCAVITLQWYSGTSLAATDTFSVLCSNGQSGAVWEIPVKGDHLTIQVANVGTVGIITISNSPSITIYGSYRIIPNTRVLETSLSAAGLTITGTTVIVQGNPIYGIAAWIASIAESYPASAITYVFPLPQWAGEVSGWYQITTTALARNMTIIDLSYAVQGTVVGGTGYADGIIFTAPSAINASPVNVSFILPPTQCALVITTSAVAGAFAAALIGVPN